MSFSWNVILNKVFEELEISQRLCMSTTPNDLQRPLSKTAITSVSSGLQGYTYSVYSQRHTDLQINKNKDQSS